MAIIMVTHDLGVIAQMAAEIIVMYGGRVCERGTADEIFYNPHHEYTKGLLRSIPTLVVFKNGEVAAKSIGVQSKEEVLKLLDA